LKFKKRGANNLAYNVIVERGDSSGPQGQMRRSYNTVYDSSNSQNCTSTSQDL
ncbi:hypothetical protein HAX54_020525, partial [Datura stramonium]|nr:hypothetical protein [Datura stramonium]